MAPILNPSTRRVSNVAARRQEVLEEIKLFWGPRGVAKLQHGYVHDCDYCDGFGFFLNENIPVNAAEARNGEMADPCPICKEDNAVFEYYRRHITEDIDYGIFSTKSESLDDMLEEFERGLRCAELSVILGSSSPQLPW